MYHGWQRNGNVLGFGHGERRPGEERLIGRLIQLCFICEMFYLASATGVVEVVWSDV